MVNAASDRKIEGIVRVVTKRNKEKHGELAWFCPQSCEEVEDYVEAYRDQELDRNVRYNRRHCFGPRVVEGVSDVLSDNWTLTIEYIDFEY
jgi:hypothetical protein